MDRSGHHQLPGSRSTHLSAPATASGPTVLATSSKRGRSRYQPSGACGCDGRTEQVCRQGTCRVGHPDHRMPNLLREAQGRGSAVVPAGGDADAWRRTFPQGVKRVVRSWGRDQCIISFRISLYECFWEHGAPISLTRKVVSILSSLLFSFGLCFFLLDRKVARHILIALGASGVSGHSHADNEKWKADSMRTRAGRLSFSNR